MTIHTGTAFVNHLAGHPASGMASMPAGSLDLIVTSPPYWTDVTADSGKNPWHLSEEHLADLRTACIECARVLRPKGKLCINIPIPKEISKQHARHLKDTALAIVKMIQANTDLVRLDPWVWEPNPDNVLASHTATFIIVLVKPNSSQIKKQPERTN
ncbi:MAG TPA: DNA methyltransferase [Xanthobacteraceae bacterium]|jgi:site-specific DNA-methyltransferase (cytosine-N4-specific)